MPIQRQIWAADIAENIFPDNSFMAMSRSDDAFVNEAGNKVHLPQAGTAPNVERNRATFPATVTERTDTVVDYDLDSFTTDPSRVRDLEEMEVSYNKRQSILFNHNEQIQTQVAAWMSYYWASHDAAQIVRTTGADRAAMAAGATGNRKAITLEDILNVKRLMDKQDIPATGRVALLPSEMYNDLLAIDKVANRNYLGKPLLADGALASIYGIDLYLRSDTVQYTNAATPALRAPGATALATANAGAIFWHSNFVRRAKGAIKIFAKEDDPEHYGSIFSAEVRAGGSKAYTNGRGIVTLVEAAGV